MIRREPLSRAEIDAVIRSMITRTQDPTEVKVLHLALLAIDDWLERRAQQEIGWHPENRA